MTIPRHNPHPHNHNLRPHKLEPRQAQAFHRPGRRPTLRTHITTIRRGLKFIPKHTFWPLAVELRCGPKTQSTQPVRSKARPIPPKSPTTSSTLTAMWLFLMGRTPSWSSDQLRKEDAFA